MLGMQYAACAPTARARILVSTELCCSSLPRLLSFTTLCTADDNATSSSASRSQSRPHINGGSAAYAARAEALWEYTRRIQGPDDEIDLLASAVLVARHKYPDITLAEVKNELDALAGNVREALGGLTYPMKVIQTINKVLYQEKGFRGNQEDYYSPDNSCINKVLEHRTGLPITLSLIYIEVAKRVGLPMGAVNLPCHLMLRPLVNDMEVLVDAFNGEVCFLPEAEQRLSNIMALNVKIDPKFAWQAPPMAPRAFLMRLLNNLKQVYMIVGPKEDALAIVRYMRMTAPSSLEELRDEGMCLYELKRWEEAEVVLSQYVAAVPHQTAEVLQVRAVLQRMKELEAWEAGSAELQA